MTESTRTATCCCGQLSYTVVGEPATSYLCHCQTCQRRIGSSHAFNTWFQADQVSKKEGEPTIFEKTNEGGTVRMEFCPTCGTTVSWTHSSSPDSRSFAVGCFVDPEFPAPQAEYFTSRRQRWMQPIEGAGQNAMLGDDEYD